MADEFIADLLPQDLVEPRKLHPTTTAVRVRAVTRSQSAGSQRGYHVGESLRDSHFRSRRDRTTWIYGQFTRAI